MADISLMPLDDRWLDDVAALVTDPAVLAFTRIPEPPPADFAQTWIRSYVTSRSEGTREGFAAVDGRGRFVGVGLAPHIDREGDEAELGYIVASGARGQGVGTEILRRLTDWAFTELGSQRLILIIDVQNHASLRVAQRCGYQREGVMRSIHVKQQRRGDAELWSRLPSDPSSDSPRCAAS
jgi:RimJ/RimL family protein N-acetyltransferase